MLLIKHCKNNQIKALNSKLLQFFKKLNLKNFRLTLNYSSEILALHSYFR